MSSSRKEHRPTFRGGNATASEIETVAKELVSLAEEVEAGIGDGHIPPAFAERLSEIRRTVALLIGP